MDHIRGTPQLLLRHETGTVCFYRALEFVHGFSEIARIAQELAGMDVLRGNAKAHARISGKILWIVGRQRISLLEKPERLVVFGGLLRANSLIVCA